MKDLEDKILTAVALALVLVMIIWWLSGCSSQKAQNLEVIWIEGADCTLISDGLTVDQAKNITQDWTFGECQIDVDSESGGTQKK